MKACSGKREQCVQRPGGIHQVPAAFEELSTDQGWQKEGSRAVLLAGWGLDTGSPGQPEGPD